MTARDYNLSSSKPPMLSATTMVQAIFSIQATKFRPSVQFSANLTHHSDNYRQQKGLPPIDYHRGLEQLSLNHSEWLRQNRGKGRRNVGHQGSRHRAKVAHTEFGMRAWGENVAYVSETPKDAATKLITIWKASPPHQKAMVGNWTHAGTGIRVDEDGAIFATMNFGRIPSN